MRPEMIALAQSHQPSPVVTLDGSHLCVSCRVPFPCQPVVFAQEAFVAEQQVMVWGSLVAAFINANGGKPVILPKSALVSAGDQMQISITERADGGVEVGFA